MSPSCHVCGTRYLDDGWASLVLSQRLEPAEVRRMVLEWPDDMCIEVRRCSSCKSLIATKQRRQAS